MTAADAHRPAPAAPRVAFEQGLARILDPSGEPVGAGFLLTRDLVCTCAHLLADLTDPQPPRPDEPVLVDFPLLTEGRSARVSATVTGWHPADDIALLRLAHEVPGAAPLPLAGPDAPLYGREARLYGFPEDTDTGVNAHGILRGGQGAGRIQLDAGHGSVPIRPGFSGSPVWDVEARHVVGLLATRGRGGIAGTAYLIPAGRLAPAGPHPSDDGGPFKGLLRFEETDAHLFLGRERETETLLSAVRERPLTLLTGQSGTGKSSLLRAGLLPRLRDTDAVVVVRTPREADDPAEFLGEALLALWEATESGADAAAHRATVREALAGDGLALAQLRERLRAATKDRLGVLVLDQFEEYAAAAPLAARRVVTWLRDLTAVGTKPVPGRGPRAVLSARHATLDVLAAALPAAERPHALVHLDPLTDEALARVIAEPLRPIPGAGLDPGLADLLLRDARTAQDTRGETNSLPLLEFTLAELWRRRSGGRLTLAAYQELGSLSGALAQHAERTLREAVDEGLADEQAARRLFQRLARPDGLGRFLPDTVPAAELDAGQLRLAQRMTREKLLVWTRPRPGEATGTGEAPGEALRMAHEALLREWEWLRTCLREGEEFRAWQADVAEHARRWREAGSRPFASAPERLLSAADHWRSERARDITDVEQAYLAAGRRQARRGAYVLRAFAATVTVLTLLAGWLAWDASRNRDTIEDQLAALASQQLADLSQERSPTDLGLSVQMAMGAWATDRTDKAGSALFRQYMRMRDVEAVHPGLWSGTVQRTASAPGRDVLAVITASSERRREVNIVTDATSGEPRVRRLDDVPKGDVADAFSDDGRWYAMAAVDGSVRLWRTDAADTGPRLLTGVRQPEPDEVYESSLDFSDDGSRLLRLYEYGEKHGRATTERAALDVWEVPSGTAVHGAGRLVAGRRGDDAAFVDEGRRVALSWIRKAPASYVSSVGVFGVSDGKEQRRLITDAKAFPDLTARGKLLHVGGKVLSVDGSRPERGIPGDFGDILSGTDASELYRSVIRRAENSSNYGVEYGVLSLFGVRDGTSWTAVVPTDDASRDEGDVAVWAARKKAGAPEAVAVVGDGLVRLKLTESAPLLMRATSQDDLTELAPDADRFATTYGGELYLSAPGGPTRSVTLPGDPDNTRWQLTWVRAQGWEGVAAWDAEGLSLVLCAADDPARRLEVDLGSLLKKGAETTTIESVGQLGNGDLAVLVSTNQVLRLDPRTGMPVAQALRVAPPEPYPPGLGSPGQLVPRPGHPTQALIVTRSRHRYGGLELWDLAKGARVTHWTAAMGVAGPLDDATQSTMRFSSDGGLVAVAHQDKKVRFWDVATGRPTGGTVPFAAGSKLIALIGTETLVSLGGNNTFRLHEVPTGRALGESLASLNIDQYSAVVTGTTVRLVARGQLQSFGSDPETWWRQLCRSADRPYTQAELKQLPPGARTGRPCSA
ncbi:trypsin-like peptidase domain-containing protein [Streptomyces griseus]|uniref:nSTAND1 domain-containing NTPase n=1 Tax=Streptomyces griseus TaxID=1911 RepID=UPI00055C269E|nr:trypsin-like peptidase domain-containing protein [Streptomyces griseus]